VGTGHDRRDQQGDQPCDHHQHGQEHQPGGGTAAPAPLRQVADCRLDRERQEQRDQDDLEETGQPVQE
jgi:hypothetical protein